MSDAKSDRRGAERWSRRLEAQFWRTSAPERKHRGYTSDVSRTGAYVLTRSPFGRDVRIRVEFRSGEQSFVTEAIVVRATRVHPELEAVRDSGMAVRFLRIDDVLHELLPGSARASDKTSEPAGPPDDSASYRVSFTTIDQLRAAWNRDLKFGGLFVSTEWPRGMDDELDLIVELPDDAPTLSCRVRVVKVFPPGDHGQSANLLAGMGVLLTNPGEVFDQLRTVARDHLGQELD